MGMHGGYGCPSFGGGFGNDDFGYDDPYRSRPAPPMRARGRLTTAPPGWSVSGILSKETYPDNGPDPGSQVLRMHGLPWVATEKDIEQVERLTTLHTMIYFQFFVPLKPTWLRILLNNEGRSSGEARVQFANDDELNEALKKDKTYMGERYIELSVSDIYS